MTKDRSWFYIAILTVAVALVWAGMTAWDRVHQTTVPADVEKAVAPLNPQLDKTVLEKLQQKNP